MKENLNDLVKKSSLYILVGKSITPIITLLVSIYIIRKLSVSDYGTYNILLALMNYIGLLSGLGLTNIFQRFIPEFRERNELSKLKRLIIHGLLWRLTLSIIIILFIILLWIHIGSLLKIKPYLNYFLIFSFGIIFALEIRLLSLALTALFLHKYFVIAQIIYTLIRAAILYCLLESGWKLKGLLLSEAIASGLLLLLQAYWLYKKFYIVNPGNEKLNFPLKRLLRYGGFSYFNEMGEQILDVSTDFFIISAFLGSQVVGIYAFANRIMQLLSRLMPHKLFMDVITPSFFTKYAQTNDPKKLDMMFNFLTKLIAFFFFPLIAAIFVLGDKLIIYIFDPKYLEALTVVWIVAGFTVINSFVYPLGLVVQSVERVEIHLFNKIFAIYNIVGDLLVIKPFGIIGVAIVTSTAILFKNIFTYIFARKYVAFSFDLKSLSVIGLNSMIMAVIVFFLRGLVVDAYSFFLIALIGGMVYVLVAYLNKGFSEDERRIINGILPKPIFVF